MDETQTGGTVAPNRQRVVDHVRTLWPTLTFIERWTWADRLKPWFGTLADSVKALDPQSGRPGQGGTA